MALLRVYVLLSLTSAPIVLGDQEKSSWTLNGVPHQEHHTLPGASADEAAKSAERHYVFGYGSLLKISSNMRTACGIHSFSAAKIDGLVDSVAPKDTTQDLAERYDARYVAPKDTTIPKDCVDVVRQNRLVPIKVQGVRKGWYSRGKLQINDIPTFADAEAQTLTTQALDLSPTYLGAVEDTNSETHGVIYEVGEAELARTDKRETSATYYAALLDPTKVQVLVPDFVLPDNARIRWYAMNLSMVQEPTPQFPICQTYVDIFVSGASEVEEANNISDFALSAVAETDAWSVHWVNDRLAPYRPFSQDSVTNTVTNLLLSATKKPGSKLSLAIMSAIYFPNRPVTREPGASSMQMNVLVIALIILLVLCSFCLGLTIGTASCISERNPVTRGLTNSDEE